MIIQRGKDVVFFHQPTLGFFHLGRIEEFNLVFTFMPRGDGGRKCPTIELFRAQFAVKHRNTHAGAGAQLNTLQRQPFIYDSEHLLT